MTLPLPNSQNHFTNHRSSSFPRGKNLNSSQDVENKIFFDFSSQRADQYIPHCKDSNVSSASPSARHFMPSSAREQSSVPAEKKYKSFQTSEKNTVNYSPLFESPYPAQNPNIAIDVQNATDDIVEVADAPFFAEVKKMLDVKKLSPSLAQALNVADMNFATLLEESGINKDEPEFYDVWQEAAQASDDILRSRIGWDAFNALSAQTLQAAHALHVNSHLDK